MVCIHSTYYIKIHLLCDIRDSAQAAGGLDSSILWPGKLWKTIVFQANKARPIPERIDHFYHCGKGQNQLIFYPIGTVPHCISSKKEPAFFISEPRSKERTIYRGPCKHPDRRSTVIPQRIIRRNRPFFTGLCSGWRTRLWEAKDVFRSSDPHK